MEFRTEAIDLLAALDKITLSLRELCSRVDAIEAIIKSKGIQELIRIVERVETRCAEGATNLNENNRYF